MKQCVKCGRELTDDEMFCPECGYVVEEPEDDVVAIPVVETEETVEVEEEGDLAVEEEILPEEVAPVEEVEIVEEPAPIARSSNKTRALGILSIVFSFLPPAGIALALCGLFSSLTEYREKGIRTGIVLSVVGLCCSFLFLAAYSFVYAWCENTEYYNKLQESLSETIEKYNNTVEKLAEIYPDKFKVSSKS